VIRDPRYRTICSVGYNYPLPVEFSRRFPHLVLDVPAISSPYSLDEFHQLSRHDAPVRKFVLGQKAAISTTARSAPGARSRFAPHRCQFKADGGHQPRSSLVRKTLCDVAARGESVDQEARD
jgi:hypothetical protein